VERSVGSLLSVISAIGALLLLLLLALPIEAQAEVDETHIIGSLSCPTTSFCAALTQSKPVVLTADPTLGGTWTATNITEANIQPTAVSCPTAEFCAVATYAGDVITSPDPASAEPTWNTAHVDIDPSAKIFERFDGTAADLPIEDISCPSTGLCVAIDADGNVLTSTEPAGPAAAWRREAIDPSHQFDAIACAPGSAFCAAVDMEGRLFVSTNAPGGASTWHSAKLAAGAVGLDYTDMFWGISCPTTGYCMAYTSQSEIFSSTEPANPASWQPQASGPADSSFLAASLADAKVGPEPTAHASGASSGVGVDGQNDMSCPTILLCAIPGFSAYEIWTTTDPTDRQATWHGAHPPQFVEGGENTVTAVSCATAQFCVAGTWLGEGLVSTDPTGDGNAWPARIAPVPVFPPQADELSVSGVSLGGWIRPRYVGARYFGSYYTEKAKLKFTVTAPHPMHPVANLFLLGSLSSGMSIPGGFHEMLNGLIVSESNGKLAKSIRITSEGERLPFAVKYQEEDGMTIVLKKPAPSITVTIASPGLTLGSQALEVLERHKQPTVQFSIAASDEVGGGGEHGVFPKIKTKIHILKTKHRYHVHRPHRGRHKSQ
jgi:hypothetical protein